MQSFSAEPGEIRFRYVQDSVAEILEEEPRGPMQAGVFTTEGGQVRAIAGLRLAWYLGFELLATPGTVALMQHKMGDVH